MDIAEYEMRQRITAWLHQFVEGPHGQLIRPDSTTIKAAIACLVDGNVMTPEEIRRECLRQQYAIIPDDYFPK